MTFLSENPPFTVRNPSFCAILANTLVSRVPGISAAGPSPEKTLYTPILDAELIVDGVIHSMPHKPNTPSGCPTPASITRSMMELTGLTPIFINAGLKYIPTVPCIDTYSSPGEDPRYGDAIPKAEELVERGKYIGKVLSSSCDTLVLGECVPGGTTTALCVLRALGYEANVSSSFQENPVSLKEEVARVVHERIQSQKIQDSIGIMRCAGDPMMPIAVGISTDFTGNLILAGGTQMLAVCALLKKMGVDLPFVITTKYVHSDTSANFEDLAHKIGIRTAFVDPDFGEIGHGGLSRYCTGEVKEGTGAGGAMALAYLMGYSPAEIRSQILRIVSQYT
ncbi:MAG: nicotinate mononucleotide-dependent phosphoribosyltransferase CobT [Methanoregulaceae archaeon]